jgi:hypothetical protein
LKAVLGSRLPSHLFSRVAVALLVIGAFLVALIVKACAGISKTFADDVYALKYRPRAPGSSFFLKKQ